MKHELFPWLILFLPLVATAVITLFTLRSKNLSSLISIGAVVAGFVLTCLFIAANTFHPDVTETAVNWMTIGGLNVICGPTPIPDTYEVTITLPLLFNNSTAPSRCPAYLGVKFTTTVQVAFAP